MPKQIQIQMPKPIQTHNSVPHLAADILPDQTLLCRVCKQNYVASLPWTYFAKEGGRGEFLNDILNIYFVANNAPI